MTPRHRETTSYAQPVRFYKAVALTFLCFTFLLLGVILFMSVKRATIIIETKATVVDVSGVLDVGGAASQLPGAVVSSTILAISDTVTPSTGRKEDARAVGTVVLHNNTNVAQALVATTRLLSPDGVMFRLKNRVEIPAQGTATADVYADAPGAGSEIGPMRFIIPGLSAEKQATIYAESTSPMIGGTRTIGIFGVEDKKAAEDRLLARLTEEGKKKFAVAASEQGLAVDVIQYAVSFDTEVGKEVSTVSATIKGTVVAVTYPKDAVREQALAMLMKRAIDDREVIRPRKDDPTISIGEYRPDSGTATVTLFYDGAATVNPDSDALDRSVFFGKTKEEIRRYVLSLDHVRGVEVEFSPFWVVRVPYSAEHVQVIVKSVE